MEKRHRSDGIIEQQRGDLSPGIISNGKRGFPVNTVSGNPLITLKVAGVRKGSALDSDFRYPISSYLRVNPSSDTVYSLRTALYWML
jgi:hypothetical protein